MEHDSNSELGIVTFPFRAEDLDWYDFYLPYLIYKEIAVTKLASSQVQTLLIRRRISDSRKYYNQAHSKISALESVPGFCI